MRNAIDNAPVPQKVPPVPARLKKETTPTTNDNNGPSSAMSQAADTKKAPVNTKFAKVSESSKTQFNKRIPKETADVFAILAVKTSIKVPDLLSEAAELLQEKYGRV